MIREIMWDTAFLSQKAEPETQADLSVAEDLLETAAHKEGFVGMAANMMGINKRIIAFDNEGSYMGLTRKSLKKQSLTRPRKAIYPSWVPEKQSAGNPLRCSTKTRAFKPALRLSLAGRPTEK